MKAHEFDAKFEADEDVREDLDLSQMKKPMLKQKRVNVDFPVWMLESLDREAHLRDPHKLLPHIIHTLSDRPVSSTTELSTAKFALALADNIAYLY